MPIKVNKKRQSRQMLLFPGVDLAIRIKNNCDATPRIGAAFECATERLLKGDRGVVNSSADVCPDLFLPDRKIFVESKATNLASSSTFRIDTFQLDKYMELKSESGWDIYYTLWLYDRLNVVKDCKTVGKLVREILSNVVACYVINVNFLQALRTTISEKGKFNGCFVKYIPSWSRWLGREYYALNIPFNYLSQDWSSENAPELLGIEDEIKPLYKIREKMYSTKSVEYNGVSFVTNEFPVKYIIEDLPF